MTMRKMKLQPWILMLVCALALAAIACQKKSEDNIATDTSATTSAIETSGTETTGTTSTTSTGSSGGTISSLDTADKEFMMKAAQGGMAEVSLGQMAALRGTNPDVKGFGSRMVTDHSKANDELKQLAQTKGIALPSEIDKESQNTADKLTKASDADFDKAYIGDMVEDHEKDVSEFEKASKDAKDPDLKDWVTKTLPTLQDHLKMAKATKAKLK